MKQCKLIFSKVATMIQRTITKVNIGKNKKDMKKSRMRNKILNKSLSKLKKS